LALIATIAWSLVDRKRRNYTRLHEWLRVYVRFALGVTMIGYGSYKVIQSQFPPPSLDRLLQPFGDASPMGLLWTFMGASGSYMSRYTLVLDPEKKTFDLGKRDDPKWKAALTYEQPEPAMLTLSGRLDGQQIRAKLRRTDDSRFLLRSRGFHWINEFPFSR
jgi:hypothetical protein